MDLARGFVWRVTIVTVLLKGGVSTIVQARGRGEAIPKERTYVK